MKNQITTLTLPASAKAEAAKEIVQTLQTAGHRALLVGGCVRSLLLDEEPKDYDVATAAHPEEVQAIFDGTVPIGIAFGVVLVRLGGEVAEVATFRADGRYIDKRRPESVTFSDEKHDAMRRDFTINALYLDPMDGKVIDHVGGLSDLRAGLVRCVGDPAARFGEDALRLVRAVRFAARCDFEIEAETLRCLRNLASTITAVSAERVGDEIVKIFTGPHPDRGLRLLDESNLLTHILPELAAMKGVEQPTNFHPEGDVFEHTANCLSYLKPSPPVDVALGVLLHDVGKPPTFERASDRIRFSAHEAVGAEMAERICRRLRLSNAVTESVFALVKGHMRFKDIPNMRMSTLKRFLLSEDFDKHLEVHRCDVLGSDGVPEMVEWCNAVRQEWESEGTEQLPAPLLNGDDLVGMGLPPGPVFREILEAVQTEQLEGGLLSREEAEAFVQSRWPDHFKRSG